MLSSTNPVQPSSPGVTLAGGAAGSTGANTPNLAVAGSVGTYNTTTVGMQTSTEVKTETALFP